MKNASTISRVNSRDPLGLLGQVLHGQFRIDDLVEDGRRSVVYRGVHLMLEVPIAIKCMKVPAGDGHEQFIRRFRHENRLHYRLSQASPHVVRVLAGGTAMSSSTGTLVPFVVLEWLEGETLAQDLATRRAQGLTGRKLAESVRLLDPAAEAFAMAHAHGIVHREVTPRNLFLAQSDDSSHVKVLDFGVAKIMSERALDVAPPSQTMGLSPVTSPAYAAPEQCDGNLGDVGPWTDVYALALVLLELLRDRPVMEPGPIPIVLRATDPKNRPTPRSLGITVSDRVEKVLVRALSVRPQDRLKEAGEFWGMLKNAMLNDRDSLRKISNFPPSPASSRRYPVATENTDVPLTMEPTTVPRMDVATALGEVPTKVSAVAATMPLNDDDDDDEIVEMTTVMAVDELRTLSLTMDEDEPVSNQAELFVAAPRSPRHAHSTVAAGSVPRAAAATPALAPPPQRPPAPPPAIALPAMAPPAPEPARPQVPTIPPTGVYSTPGPTAEVKLAAFRNGVIIAVAFVALTVVVCLALVALTNFR
jgi:serine/threonine protein kinase